MSISIHAVVKPSRILFALTGGMCCSILFVAAAIGFGMVGNLSRTSQIVIGLNSLFIAFSVFYQQARARSEFHIHISGSGQIRLTELKSINAGRKSNRLVVANAEARLMAATTIWPWLLLLRLQLDDKVMITVPILPDCMPADTFRALSVTCRWLGAHEHSIKY
jgi:toxin CptA